MRYVTDLPRNDIEAAVRFYEENECDSDICHYLLMLQDDYVELNKRLLAIDAARAAAKSRLDEGERIGRYVLPPDDAEPETELTHEMMLAAGLGEVEIEFRRALIAGEIDGDCIGHDPPEVDPLWVPNERRSRKARGARG